MIKSVVSVAQNAETDLWCSAGCKRGSPLVTGVRKDFPVSVSKQGLNCFMSNIFKLPYEDVSREFLVAGYQGALLKSEMPL